MTESDPIQSNLDLAPRGESPDETVPGECRNGTLGLLITLTVAAGVYGAIAICIWKFF